MNKYHLVSSSLGFPACGFHGTRRNGSGHNAHIILLPLKTFIRVIEEDTCSWCRKEALKRRNITRKRNGKLPITVYNEGMI